MPLERRIMIIERFIQLMINSGHKYSFIRSVVQQGITKFLYMVERSKLRKNDKKFQPLYRPPDYRATERMMQRYTEELVWYKRINLKDDFRHGWKFRLKEKATRGKKPAEKKKPLYDPRLLNLETTTAIFIPPSCASQSLGTLEGWGQNS